MLQRLPAPGQPLPNFQPAVSPQPPLPFACTLGQSNRSTRPWQNAQALALARQPRYPSVGLRNRSSIDWPNSLIRLANRSLIRPRANTSD